MGSIRGFRCGVCRAEVLAKPGPGALSDRTDWSPPVLCCGKPLIPVEPDQVLMAMPSRRPTARCPRCGYEIHLVIHPAGPLACVICQTDLVILGGTPDRDVRGTTPVTPTPDVQ